MSTLKDFYTSYSDEIIQKRYQSPYPLRHHAHTQQYESVVRFVEPGMNVLDAGCGEGILSVLMAKKGAHVTGCDISEPNVARSRTLATDEGVNVEFLTADAENLPFPDSSFDLVVSSHVLEHLPSFDRGLDEVMRVTKKRAVVAIPTLPNPCSLVQVGGGWFYLKGFRSFGALPIGIIKTIYAFLTGKEGVDETYAGTGASHVFRFPWVLPQKARQRGYSVVDQEASTICLPYFSGLLPIIRYLDKHRKANPLKSFGYGTTYVLEKN